jgi:AcrR family transcriptional regulator
MKSMSTDYVESGRTRQKQRTRDQLIAAARELITSGDTPRVEEVAEAAGISRPTAYRYFGSQAELLAAAYPETAAASVLPDPPPEAVDERVAAVAGFLIGRVEASEPQQRAMLRLSLGNVPHDLPLRQGRAIPWFLEALAPIAESIGEESLHRLALALRAASGIETRVWLTDIAGLAPGEVSALQQWMVDALVKQALQTGPPSGQARRAGESA